jgi:hypothetical protein
VVPFATRKHLKKYLALLNPHIELIVSIEKELSSKSFAALFIRALLMYSTGETPSRSLKTLKRVDLLIPSIPQSSFTFSPV